MKITLTRDKLEILDCSFRGEIFSKLNACPDNSEFKNGRFFASASDTNVEYFLNTFQNILWEGEASTLKYKFLASKKEEESLKNKPLSQEYYDKVFKTKPFNHQLEAFKLSKDAKAYAYFFEQGCGKTKVTIDNAVYLFLKDKIDAFIIVAPNGVHMNWIKEELPIHCKLDYDAFCWNGKTTKAKIKEFEDVCNSDKPKIFAFNIEAFVSDKAKDKITELMSRFRCMLAIDESQSIKNPSAKRTQFFVGLMDKIKKVARFVREKFGLSPDPFILEIDRHTYKRILSGTPVTKDVLDLFSQLYFLNPNIIGLKNEHAFKARYCETKKMTVIVEKSNDPFKKPKTRTFNKIVGHKNTEELQEKIEKYSFRVLKKDCLDLPPKLYQREFYDLTPEQRQMEQEIKDEGITFMKNCKEAGKPIVYNEVITRLMKRQQVLGGFLIDSDSGEVMEIMPPDKNPRLLKLREVLDRINGKVIIWARFDQDIKYIMDMLGDEAVRYDGHVNIDQKEINKNRFQKDDSVKYFVAKPIKGLTLTAAGTAIYYSNDFDLEKRQQSEDRNHRSGSEKLGVDNILYIDIQAMNTIDGQIITSLRNKKKISDMILKDPESMFLK